MTLAFAAAVFILAYASVWLLLQRRLFDAVLGFGILAHVGNLIMLASGGFGTRAPLVDSPAAVPSAPASASAPVPLLGSASATSASTTIPTSGVMSDPLPQALILTAIVISMAVLIYLVALFRRSAENGEEDWS